MHTGAALMFYVCTAFGRLFFGGASGVTVAAGFCLAQGFADGMRVKVGHGPLEVVNEQGAEVAAEAVTHQYAHDHEVFAVSGHGVGRHLPAA